MFLSLFYLFLITTVLVKLILIGLNIKSIKQNFDKVPEEFTATITQEEHQKAQRYSLAKAKLSIVSILLDTGLILGWLSFGGIEFLTQFSWGESVIINGILFIILFTLINSIVSLPLGLYSVFVIEDEFGFNKMTPKLFFIDLIKQFILSLIIGIPLLYGILSFLYHAGELWWFYAWIFFMAFQILMIWAYPKFIAPLFNKFEPLEDQDLTQKIESLLESCQLAFKDFYKMNASIRSSHGNAYFTGFGKNRRIVFFDTLLSSLSSTEIIAVLAHELGHLKMKHILKSIILSALGLFIGLYILSIAVKEQILLNAFGITLEEKYVQLLLFTLVVPYFTFFLTPLGSWFSRRNEFQADEFAATHADAKDLISALLKLIKENSSSITPHPVYSKFYFSHPPPKERIAFLTSLQKVNP